MLDVSDHYCMARWVVIPFQLEFHLIPLCNVLKLKAQDALLDIELELKAQCAIHCIDP